MSNCIFCNIINKSLPAKIMYEDEDVIVFDDLYPKAPCHKLIVPKQHIATLNDLDEKQMLIAGKLLYTAQQIAKQLGHAENGYRTIMNCNKDGGQVIYHIHLHLLAGHRLNDLG